MSSANILAGVIFSGIGFAAFIYGKKQSRLKTMLLGAALMGYPFLISDTTTVIIIGIILTTAIFIIRD